MAVYARDLIGELNEGDGGTAEATVPEPAFEIEEVRDEPGGYDFEIGLGDEITHERSADVDRLARELSRDGIHGVLREDRDLILVRAPSWSSDGLQTWIAQTFEDRRPLPECGATLAAARSVVRTSPKVR